MAETSTVENDVRLLLADVLGLDLNQVQAFDDDTELFGAIPELDSMAVATLLTEMEDRMDIEIDDDEVEADIFLTFGAFVEFARDKVAA